MSSPFNTNSDFKEKADAGDGYPPLPPPPPPPTISILGRVTVLHRLTWATIIVSLLLSVTVPSAGLVEPMMSAPFILVSVIQVLHRLYNDHAIACKVKKRDPLTAQAVSLQDDSLDDSLQGLPTPVTSSIVVQAEKATAQLKRALIWTWFATVMWTLECAGWVGMMSYVENPGSTHFAVIGLSGAEVALTAYIAILLHPDSCCVI